VKSEKYFVPLQAMKKILDLTVCRNERISDHHVLLRLTHDERLPEMIPGQFVEVRIDQTPSVFLRRPISICFVDRTVNELWLLVATIGDGTRWLGTLKVGDIVNCVLPLGNGFAPLQSSHIPRLPLLIGGGVGVAPLLYLGACLQQAGSEVTFLLGGRSAKDVLLLDEFKKYGRVLVTTEDATLGEKGFVTNHSVLTNEHFDAIYTCGPTPMMKAVVRYAREKHIECEASLENMMACGLEPACVVWKRPRRVISAFARKALCSI